MLVRKGYLVPGRADDSLDLELGASASRVQGSTVLEHSSRQSSTRRASGNVKYSTEQYNTVQYSTVH